MADSHNVLEFSERLVFEKVKEQRNTLSEALVEIRDYVGMFRRLELDAAEAVAEIRDVIEGLRWPLL